MARSRARVFQEGAGGVRDKGVLRPRPSGLPPASQRRTIGVVVRRMIEGNRPRRWHAGGLRRGVERCTGSFCREGCPAAPLCGACRAAGATSVGTMACPARPGGDLFTYPRENAGSVPGSLFVAKWCLAPLPSLLARENSLTPFNFPPARETRAPHLARVLRKIERQCGAGVPTAWSRSDTQVLRPHDLGTPGPQDPRTSATATPRWAC